MWLTERVPGYQSWSWDPTGRGEEAVWSNRASVRSYTEQLTTPSGSQRISATVLSLGTMWRPAWTSYLLTVQ